MQTGKLLDVDIHFFLEPKWGTRPSCHGCGGSADKGAKGTEDTYAKGPITSGPAESCIQFSWSVYLCLVLMNLLLGVVPHSSSPVTMAVPMPLWDVTSGHLSQVKDSPVWISIRDFLIPPDMLAVRTAGPK